MRHNKLIVMRPFEFGLILISQSFKNKSLKFPLTRVLQREQQKEL